MICDPLAMAIEHIDMDALWNQIDPALARYAGYTLVGVVVLALLVRRRWKRRWPVIHRPHYSRRCLSITFPFGCNVPDENAPVGKSDNGSGHD